MSISVVPEGQLFLGIDGGGSKCKAVITDEAKNILGVGISGPANPLHGYEQTLNSVVHSAQLALEDANLSQTEIVNLIAGVGLAGVNLPSLFEKVAAWQHPFKQLYLTTDLHIACLGAHDGGDGAVMITGTGSCGFSWVNEKSLIIGGHGFPHGDLGSGAWIGFQAIASVLLALDDLGPQTSLAEKYLAHYQAADALDLVAKVAKQPASFYATSAGIVFTEAEQGDKVAKEIIETGASYISNLARKLWCENPPRMTLIGGLGPLLTPWLEDDIAQRLSKPCNPPEIGAVLFAKQQVEAQQKAG